jgi:cytochrome c oxidase accessory protein FixG
MSSMPSTKESAAGANLGSMPLQTLHAHRKIYPRATSGVFTRWRWAMVWVALTTFHGLCWLSWNDRQAVLFDLAQGKFYLFDWIFWPQDVFYLFVLLIVCASSLFLLTAVAGRLWCGYACPQTVYAAVFLWIERRIEGDHLCRQKLDAQAFGPRKLALRSCKYVAWAIVGLWTGFTFVGYFSPVRVLLPNLLALRLGVWEVFWIVFYGGLTCMMAGFMREQVCRYMCPYAPLQDAMVGRGTLAVTYDAGRGEPRGAQRGKGGAEGHGECVDCGICVQVCPMGIDIRGGPQHDCIGCAACIDACDQVMDGMKLRRGLIRYAIEDALGHRWGGALRYVLRPRVLGCLVVLWAIIGAAAWMLAHRESLRVDVIRDLAMPAQELAGDPVENVYTLQFVNMAEASRRVAVAVSGLDGITIEGAREFVLSPATDNRYSVHVLVPAKATGRGPHKIQFEVRPDDTEGMPLEEKTIFIVP